MTTTIITDTDITSMTTMNMNITSIRTMNTVPVDMTMKKKIAVCVDTIITGIVMMTTMNIALADTIIQAVAANIITAPQKRW